MPAAIIFAMIATEEAIISSYRDAVTFDPPRTRAEIRAACLREVLRKIQAGENPCSPPTPSAT